MAKRLLISFIWAIKMDTRHKTQDPRHKTGSALILAVVLTSLLAIIGVMFLLSSRVDWVGTSSIADNKDLGSAVDTVIAQISEVLAFDVPGDPCWPQEYYDYPDANNAWLACLEPYYKSDTNDYRWRQISDIYGSLYPLSQGMKAEILPDYNSTPLFGAGTPADADGDGVSDSMWVQVPNISSGKGKPIYAAIRIIDNGGMLNVNTGYKFNPNSSIGSSQMDINLMALSWRPNDPNRRYDPSSDAILLLARNPDLADYENGVIWRYDNYYGLCTPFDISDELEMRYRFLLNQADIDTRLEEWGGEFRKRVNSTPYGTGDIGEWFKASCIDANASNLPPDSRYAYRHIATTYNLDRVINPSVQKMVNINTAEPNAIRDAIWAGLIDANVPGDVNGLAAQITANLIDYRDSDSNVTVVYEPNGIPHFGFETPCIYISEIAQRFVRDPDTGIESKSYAIELYKPYWEDPYPSTDPNDSWRLVIPYIPWIPISWSGTVRFHVIENIVTNAYIPINFSDVNGPNDINEPDINRVPQHANFFNFNGGEFVQLERRVPATGTFLTVDYVYIPEPNSSTGWLQVFDACDINDRVYSYQRDISPHKPIRRLWDIAFGRIVFPTLGYTNDFVDMANPEVIQAHPANHPFTNVGEFGQLFYRNTYQYPYGGIYFWLPDVGVTELNMRINLADSAFQQIFKYLTVTDPTAHITTDPCGTETRVKGRININTAPWFVIAQLPWVTNGTPSYELAQAIVAYRDKLNLVNGVIDYSLGRGLGIVDPCGTVSVSVREEPGFASIGELMNVTNNLARPSFYDSRCDIRKYAADATDLNSLPDLTPNDGESTILKSET